MSDFNTYKIEDIIPSKDGQLIVLRAVDIKQEQTLERGQEYFVRFESTKEDQVPEFNR